MTKRSFFKSIMGVVATIALAPEIAFRVKLEMPKAVQYWEINGQRYRVEQICLTSWDLAMAS